MAECTSNTTYAPYEYNGNTMLIERYLVLGEQECGESEYDSFDMTLNPFAWAGIETIAANGYSGFELYDELNREHFNAIKFYENPHNKKLFLYSEVFSKTKTKMLLCIQASNSKSKHWINGKCLAINQSWSYYYLTFTLNKGVNTLVFEQFSPEPNTLFSIQLMNYTFQMSDDIRALSNVKHLFQIDPLILVSEHCYRPAESTYRFMYLKNDKALKEDYRIDIHDSKTGFVKTLNARLGEAVEIDINELRTLHPETLRHEWIGCYFKDTEDKDVVVGPGVFVNDFIQKAEEINTTLLFISKELPCSVYENAMVKYNRLKAALQSEDSLNAYWPAWVNQEFLNQLEACNYPHDYYKSPGVHEFFIHSELDDSSIRMGARIPKDYDKDRAYPVFIALATFNDGSFSWWLPEDELPEPCLCFDVTGRGFTGGSYIAEASTWEVIEWIRQNYNIDEDRVYVLGQSNGGFSTWALAQNHPHFPAAIYPHVGYPQIETVDNISNIPTYQMVSPKDHVFIGREKEVKKKISKYGNYHELFFEEMIHNSFNYYIAHKGILKQMLDARRDRYPRQIIYTTCRNRHLESFWIKIHGIEMGKQFAKIKATIENERTIKIVVNGAAGITVTLPPQIERDSFELYVNGKIFYFKKPDKRQLHFTHSRTWKIADNAAIPDYRKGTGLLDIYMNSLRIIVPDDCPEAMWRVAENFVTPTTSGAYPEVFTKYPVYEVNSVPDHIFGHNLLLPETAEHPNPYIKRFVDKLPVRCDEAGYTYNGTRADGKYVVMQVIPNPYDPSRTFLIISTNDDVLLRRHILLRKVIIPTYINGIHPLWNNEILIFDGMQYLAAYEIGSTLNPVNSVKAD